MNRKIAILSVIAILLTIWYSQWPQLSIRFSQSENGALGSVEREMTNREVPGTNPKNNQIGTGQVVGKQPDLVELRKRVLVRATETSADQDVAFAQEEAIRMLASMRTPQSVSIIAELFFLPEDEFFQVGNLKGQRTFSYSFVCMDYLYDVLEGAPTPINGRSPTKEDLVVWRKWWMQHKDKLVFRDPTKPVPMPTGLTSKPGARTR